MTSPTIREQAIQRYVALMKKGNNLARKNQMVQTNIADYLRKNKIDIPVVLSSIQTSDEDMKEDLRS